MRDRQYERDLARPEVKKKSAARRQRRRNPRPANTVKDSDIFSACFEHAAIGLSLTDLEGRVGDANAAYCSITGYTQRELKASVDLRTLIHPSDLPLALEKMRALIAGEVPAFVVEHRYVKKDNSIAWVQNSVSLVSDKDD